MLFCCSLVWRGSPTPQEASWEVHAGCTRGDEEHPLSSPPFTAAGCRGGPRSSIQGQYSWLVPGSPVSHCSSWSPESFSRSRHMFNLPDERVHVEPQSRARQGTPLIPGGVPVGLTACHSPSGSCERRSAPENGFLDGVRGRLSHLTHPNPAAPTSGLGLRSSFPETSRPSWAHPIEILCSQQF